MSAVTATTPAAPRARIAMRDRVGVGQTWRRRARRRDDQVAYRVAQVHRADRLAELTDGAGQRFTVGFTELRRRYRLVP